MISNFVIKNMSNGSSITFGQTTDAQCLYQDDGLDWGTAPANHHTFSYPNQLGEDISDTSVKGRPISIVAYVYYILDESDKQIIPPEEYDKYCYERMLEKKELLNNIINPTQFVQIQIGDYYIEGKPDKSVAYGKDVRTNNEYFCAFTISIFCGNPMFRKLTLPNTAINGVSPAFRFPLVFKDGAGIIMGIRNNYRLITIKNEGNAPTGGIFRIKTSSTIKNPRIVNLETSEYIEVKKTMVQGEEVEINTNDGKEKGIKGFIGGEELNYYAYWDFNNTWMKFPIGVTLIGFSVEEGNEADIELSITMNPLKYALEEM